MNEFDIYAFIKSSKSTHLAPNTFDMNIEYTSGWSGNYLVSNSSDLK